MALPKHKLSKSRRDKRRTHYKLTGPNLVRCSQCDEMKMPHRICPKCGTYRKRSYIETE